MLIDGRWVRAGNARESQADLAGKIRVTLVGQPGDTVYACRDGVVNRPSEDHCRQASTPAWISVTRMGTNEVPEPGSEALFCRYWRRAVRPAAQGGCQGWPVGAGAHHPGYGFLSICLAMGGCLQESVYHVHVIPLCQ